MYGELCANNRQLKENKTTEEFNDHIHMLTDEETDVDSRVLRDAAEALRKELERYRKRSN